MLAKKIMFEAVKGSLEGKKFEFEQNARVFIGRQEDCGIAVPENTVSRYHCVLEITSSEAKLQDFGSLNGTFLNGEKIGQRDRSQSWEDVKDEERQEYILKNGDILGLGSRCELRLTIEAAETCAQCGAELPSGYEDGETVPEDAQPLQINNKGEHICEECYIKNKKEQLDKDIAGKKALEEAQRKKAEEARIAAEQAEQARIVAQREEKRAEAERQRKAAEKAAAERKEAERLARELAAQLAEKARQKECTGCGKRFTPTAPDNSLCPECLADRAKMIDAVLKNMLGGALVMPGEKAAGPSPVKGYEKVKLLGKGGMGEVWKVRNTSSGKFYALKTMLPQVAADANARTIFLREADIGKYLKHRNVVKTHETGCTNGVFYILMDLCEGGSVDSLMEKNGGKLSIKQATYIILQVLSGLDYVHNLDVQVEIQKLMFKGAKDAHGVVHRDFKPANIFLSDTSDKPVAMVADFGMAKAFDTAGLSRITKTGVVMGTPVFMPRQQAVDFKYAKPEVDVWAAAASYYNMLTGTFPKNFRPGKNVWQIIVTEPAVPIRKHETKIPEKLAAVIDRALVEQPSIGCTSASTLRRNIVSALPGYIKNEVKGVI